MTTNLDNFYKGVALTDGNCFFDSVRQCLAQQGIKVTVQQLRKICSDFASSVPVPDWFRKAVQNSMETLEQYQTDILRSNRWGHSGVEGRILCEKFNIKLHLIEKYITSDDNTRIYHTLYHTLTDSSGHVKSPSEADYYGKNVIHIINEGRNHFEPLLHKNLQEQKGYGSLNINKDFELAKRLQSEEDSKYAKELQEKELQICKDFELAQDLQMEEILTHLTAHQNIQPASRLTKLLVKIIEVLSKLIIHHPADNTEVVVDEYVNHCNGQVNKHTLPSCKMEAVHLTHCTPSHAISCT